MISRLLRTAREWRLNPRRGLDFLGDWFLLPLAGVRRRFNHSTTFIGVTGSGGKTTTKELIHRVLASRLGGTVSAGSRNRSFEVSRVLWATSRHHDYCVQELGAFAPGTLDALIAALKPSIGVVTSVAREHYVAFHGVEAVAEEKAKLVRAVPAGGTGVLNVDDPLVREMAPLCRGRVITVGRSPDAELRVLEAASAWPDGLRLTVGHEAQKIEVRTGLLGTHWSTAVLAALGVGMALDIPLEESAHALADAQPSPQRLSVERFGDGVVFIRDDWSAATWTVPAALEVLACAAAERRWLVLGQLSDDPLAPRKLYPRTARKALEVADRVLLVGRWAKHGLRARTGPDDRRVMAFDTVRELHTFLEQELRRGDVVLVKAVGMTDHLERLVLARTTGVHCWRDRCGRQYPCCRCRLRNVDS